VFVLKGTPLHSWPSQFEQSARMLVAQEASEKRLREFEEEEARRTNPEKHIDPATPINDLARCHNSVIESPWGPCGEGEVRLKTDPIVVNLPRYFSDLLPG
jgi:hypothetical protein